MRRGTGKSNIDIVKDYLAGERPFVQVGYTGQQYTKRKVGDRWTDSKGIEWEQKESGPQRVNRVADIIRAAREEKCRCGQVIKWGSRLDELFFRKTGLCENCLIEYETKLRVVGVYPDYEKYKILSNQLGVLKDAKEHVKDVIKFFSSDSGDVEMLCNSEGFTERWANTNRDQILENAKKDLKFILEKITEITQARDEAKQKYKDGAEKYQLDTYVR